MIAVAFKSVVVLLALVGAVVVVGFGCLCFGAADMVKAEDSAKDYR